MKSTPPAWTRELHPNRVDGGCFSQRSPILRKLECRSLLVIFCFLLALPAWRAPAQVTGGAEAPTVLDVGDHHRTIRTSSGQVYTELACGLNYRSQSNENDKNQYLPSQEIISLINGYGVATQGVHQAIFANSLTDSPTVDYAHAGQRFQTRPLLLAYFDRSSGKSAMICETVPSVAQIDPAHPEQLTYPDAFSDGVKGSIRYSYKRSSFSQDILVLAQLPSPVVWSLNPEFCRIQVWTELLDWPEADFKNTTFIYQEMNEIARANFVEPDFPDTFVQFKELLIPRGRAFAIDSEVIRQARIDVGQEVPVGKEFVTTDDQPPRRFCVESADLAVLQPLLDTLPTASVAKPDDKTSRLARLKQSNGLSRPQFVASLPRPSGAGFQPASPGVSPAKLALARSERMPDAPQTRPQGLLVTKTDEGGANSGTRRRDARSTTEGRQDARSTTEGRRDARPTTKAVVLDYVMVVTADSFTFRPETYSLVGPVTLSGTNTLLGGAVIKIAQSGSPQISISGHNATLLCSTAPFSPGIFTSADDQTTGQSISESNPSPSGWYGNYALYFDLTSSGVLPSLHDLRVMYTTNGLGFSGTVSGTGSLVRNSQFYRCQSAIYVGYTWDVLLRNVLISGCTNLITGWGGTVKGENLTLNQTTYLTNAGSVYIYLTNSVLYGVSNPAYTAGSSNAVASSNPFQTVGGSSSYLANPSPYRNAGSTGIDLTLAQDLRQRSTFPPVSITDAITNDLVLNPQAQRDTDAPDLGFHPDILDFILGSTATTNGLAITNATLTLTNGVCVGVYGNVGLKMQNGSRLYSFGSPTNLNRFLRLESTQEQGGSSGAKTAIFADDLVSGTLPEARLRFTDLPLLSNGGRQFSGGSQMGVLALQDSHLYGGGVVWNTNGTSGRTVALTNNVWEWTTNAFGTGADPVTVYARNNLFKNGSLSLSPTNSNNWAWYANAFDTLTITQNGNSITNASNGYISTNLATTGRLSPTNPTFATGREKHDFRKIFLRKPLCFDDFPGRKALATDLTPSPGDLGGYDPRQRVSEMSYPSQRRQRTSLLEHQ